jgi:hypothetical protein
MFPGITDGLEHLVTLAPQVKRIIAEISDGIGTLADEAGKGLAGPKWAEFFNFLEHDAKPILLDMGRTIGNLATGVAHLFVDFLPESQKFSNGLLEISRRFEHWAATLDQTEGFQHFLDYIDKSGPEALDFLGAIVNAFLAIVEAAAPVGNVMLPAFTDLLNVFAQVANTPLGSIFIALGAAMSVYGRAVAIGSNVTTGMNRNLGIANTEAIKNSFAFRTLARDILTYSRSVRSADAATLASNATRAEAVAGIQRWGKSAARVGGQAALLVGATTGIADKMHLGNTATLAMAGSLAGPWGAAIGAGVGLVLDFAHGQSDSAAATTDFTQTLNQQNGAITENTRLLAAQALQKDGAFQLANQLGIGLDTLTQAAVGNAKAMAEVNGVTAAYLGITKPGYTAGGAAVIDPQQAKAAGDLRRELGLVTSNIKGAQQRTRELSVATGHNATITEDAAKKHRLLKAQLQAEQQAAAETSQKFLALNENTNKAKVSLDKWIHQMANQAKALAEFGANARKAADRGLRDGLIAQLQQLGPEGALRLRQLANASQQEIGKANRAWDAGQRAAKSYSDAVSYVNNHPAVVTINGVPQSLSQLRSISDALAQIRSKTITVTTRHATGGRSVAGYDTGGFTGWGGHYEPAGIVHRNELVLPESVVKADWGFLKSRYGYLPGFSEGGLVGMSLGATPQAAGSGSAMSVEFGDVKLAGVLTGADGLSARVEGIARVVAREEIDADRDFDRKMANR